MCGGGEGEEAELTSTPHGLTEMKAAHKPPFFFNTHKRVRASKNVSPQSKRVTNPKLWRVLLAG